MFEIELLLQNNLKKALKEKDTLKLNVLRGLLSVFKNFYIEKKNVNIKEKDLIQLVKSEIKKRKDAIILYEQGGRDDLIEKEKKEIEILEQFLPEQLSEQELKELVANKIKELGIENISVKHKGKIIQSVMAEVGDRVDGSLVAKVVDDFITS